MSTTQTATPAKLRNGSWGARVPGKASEGDTVTISTRSGKSWSARVSRVLWTGTDRSGSEVSLCATKSLDRTTGRGTWTGCSCGSVEEYERDSDCWTCRHDRD